MAKSKHKTEGNKDEFRSMDDMISDGDAQLADFMPYPISGSDMVTDILRDPQRMDVYFDRQPPKNSTFYNPDRSINGFRLSEIEKERHPSKLINPTSKIPDYVVITPIRWTETRAWQYDDEIGFGPRVFVEKDQGLEIHLEETLKSLSATAPEVRKMYISGLIRENANLNNQVILDKMHRNIQEGLSMFSEFSMTVPLLYNPFSEEEK